MILTFSSFFYSLTSAIATGVFVDHDQYYYLRIRVEESQYFADVITATETLYSEELTGFDPETAPRINTRFSVAHDEQNDETYIIFEISYGDVPWKRLYTLELDGDQRGRLAIVADGDGDVFGVEGIDYEDEPLTPTLNVAADLGNLYSLRSSKPLFWW